VTVEALIAQVEELSAPAPSVVKLLELLNRVDLDNEAVVEVVRTDVVLSAKMLALVNSAYFAPPSPVESLNEALFFLGYEQVHRLAVAIGLGGIMNRKAAGYAMDEGEFWRHSLLTAKAGELVARDWRKSEGNVGYTAGLLHDIGKLVLNQTLDRGAQEEMRRAIEERGQAGLVAEQNLLGTNHAEVGAALLRKWSLSEHIVEAVEFHHEQAGSEERLPAVIALADGMAHMAASGVSGLTETTEKDLLERLQIERTKYEELLGEVSAALEEIETVAAVR
jgi:putative nucleotidyltransferase with HDIG domain